MLHEAIHFEYGRQTSVHTMDLRLLDYNSFKLIEVEQSNCILDVDELNLEVGTEAGTCGQRFVTAAFACII